MFAYRDRRRIVLTAVASLAAALTIPGDRATAQEAQSAESRPAVAIAFPEGWQIEKGEPLTIEMRHRDIPPGSGLVLDLVRDAPKGRNRTYLGSDGPLMLAPREIAGSGSFAFTWNGREVGCAPTDVPTLCDDVEVGRYRLRATIYDRADAGILGLSDKPRASVVASTLSLPLRIVGEPNLDRLLPWMRGRASSFLRSAAVGRRSPGPGDNFIAGRLDLRQHVRRTDAGYCAAFDLAPPFSGVLTACAPKDTVNDIGIAVPRVTVSGAVDYKPGALRYEDALAEAFRLADAPYLLRVGSRRQPSPGKAGATYLTSAVQDWWYRAASHAWLFAIWELKRGGAASADRFADKLLVRVHDSGDACVVETVPLRSEFTVDPRTDPATDLISCP